MNIEEAIERIKELELVYQIQYSILEHDNYIKNKEALELVLNELDKKDKVIDMMAECIDGEPTFGYGHLRDINTPEKVKKYFYKLVEGNIDKK